ncbi:M16 family metallopeptidase [Micromonospora sp. NBC_01813]|uniref:M16 family metallopeptidase n=1 Tax=Micromonospora sp. NBC_01813 TaxID=2975988 RepID=UPI002DDA7299|nr:insulinase family protein [Micromonospora sp. NBC_01813]WSA08513.1 insulinase family protein [Micromonospora sp. NBC_01813]
MIRQLDVDGVPALLAPTGGPTHAGLMFRVGQADETLARRGLTHLLEHLVLHPLGAADYHYNGTTGSVVTHFHLQGSVDDITTFLTGVCASLRELPVHRLATEKAILDTEWAGRSPATTDQLPLWRHGARDYGLSTFAELGLPAITDEDLQEWAARYFTRENAVLWLAGAELPSGLRLDLPTGSRMPAPVASSALPSTPAYFHGPGRATATDMVVPAGAAASVLTGVLERELFRALRQRDGLSYTTAAHYEPRGDGNAVITAVADAPTGKETAVLGGFIDVLAKIRVGRVDETDVAAVVGKATASLSSMEADGARLPSMALDLLTGQPVASSDDRTRQLKEVTVESVQAVATTALKSALLMTPRARGADWAGFVEAESGTVGLLPGTSHRGLGGLDGQRLVIGAQGVSLVSESGQVASVRYDRCVAMLAWPDGGRQLIGDDAISIRLEPTVYQGATAELADAAIPAQLRVDMPARDPQEIPQPETADGSPGRYTQAGATAGGAIDRFRGLSGGQKLKVGALGLVTVVVGAAALGLTIALLVGAVGFRPLPAIGSWMTVGYLGRAFLKAWKNAY